jgi:hypothetical protein
VHYIAERLRKYDQTDWHIFSSGVKSYVKTGNLHLFPVDREEFVSSLVRSKGVLTGGGFETPAEAMYMGKKIMSIPIQKQYEQQCNAEALRLLGYPVFEKLDAVCGLGIEQFISSDLPIPYEFVDHRERVIQDMLSGLTDDTPYAKKLDFRKDELAAQEPYRFNRSLLFCI